MYNYEDLKPKLFTEEGQTTFIKIRDHVKKTLLVSGAISAGKAMSAATGDSWLMLACVDRLVETGELREVTQEGVFAQHRLFVSANPN
jgi:hypothetical protein